MALLRGFIVMALVGLAASIHAPSNQTAPKFLQGVEAEAASIISAVERKVSVLTHMDKKSPNLPEQGFQGKGVSHTDMESATGDWTQEYGPKTKARTSGALRVGNSAISIAVAVFAARAVL
mmetsp:Transcript_43201/g.99598  ORF Transcript_43201/g.99598 Transcript_43201/m.99598 type:complete len:121 (+) Transcript_43201:71-433(+)